MEKRLFLAIALSILILMGYSVLVAKITPTRRVPSARDTRGDLSSDIVSENRADSRRMPSDRRSHPSGSPSPVRSDVGTL